VRDSVKSFAFINQKGGVGKTTLAINLARALTLFGKKVLLVDFDPQANASSGLGVRVKKEESVYQALVEGSFEPFVKEPCKGLFLLPSSIDLVGLEVELVKHPEREKVLKDFLSSAKFGERPLKEAFDFIFIDSPPSLSLITVNVLTASEGVIIPLQCEYYALEGLSLLIRTVRKVKAAFNPDLRLFGMVLTMYDSRNRLSQEVAEEARRHFPWLLFNTVIPRSVRVSEAPSFGKPVILYDDKSAGSVAYQSLAKVILEK
jgi:chromosome partitioning protein